MLMERNNSLENFLSEINNDLSVEIDMNGFIPGLYILEAKSQELSQTFKIIKE